MPHILAINCGSSSIKGKLYAIPSSSSEPLSAVATLGVSNIGAKGEKVQIKVKWSNEGDRDVDEEGDDGDSVDYKAMVPLLLDKIISSGSVQKDDIKYVAHRVVHGGEHKRGIRISKGHEEGLAEMDALSEFAPLHNHHAVLAVRSCLDALPNHTSLLLFDTLFHQTIPPETYTYAIPPPDTKIVMPLRKYGFHGLSYASIVSQLAEHLGKPESKVNVVVAHLGSGASSCCIKRGQSIDTSMGLTPLEGLIGGTRSGTIDPTAIFHAISDPGSDAGLEGMKVSKAEMILNKKSGLSALAGTTDFGLILSRLDASKVSADDHRSASLAYAVYLDRLLGYVSQYLFKLLATTPLSDIDGIVFSGGIGERGAKLRHDVLDKFTWLGAEIDSRANDVSQGSVREITVQGSKLRGWVVETDEEGLCAELTRQDFGF
ncbi:Acetokinase family-domain-containing protein [Kockovaella imperatae]|uniref:Probable acetate kinase n=1 Tax=Kockovaella imperatae TaxID=4999 RepID=A0A1Y1UJC5_9TREE|nr:Acetokinase family-domain-containing protein [Kockovaella imperatae]ORX37225.1 Acetokinase family-domain-containing protein [Kockovaella imperatae]